MFIITFIFFFNISVCLASNSKQSTPLSQSSVNTKSIEKRVSELENQIADYKRYLKIGQTCEDKLVEISEKNLAASTFFLQLLSVVVVIITAVGGVTIRTIYVIFKNRYEKSQKGFEEKSKELKDMKEEILLQHYKILAISLDNIAFALWSGSNFDQSINIGEKALDNYSKYLVKHPDDNEMGDYHLNCMSSLAYYYAEGKRTDKKRKAIKYVQKTIEKGTESENLNLIDSYLYVTMIFEHSMSNEEKERWVSIFEDFGTDIFEAGIRSKAEKEGDPDEQEQFTNFYNKLTNELKTFITT